MRFAQTPCPQFSPRYFIPHIIAGSTLAAAILVAMSGIAFAAWVTNGVPLTPEPLQFGSRSVSDGAGGVILAWAETGSATGNHIYAQRLDSVGNRVWGTTGVSVCQAPVGQDTPSLVADGAGGAVIFWVDHRNGGGFDIYAQRLDATGAPLWATDGVAIAVGANNQVEPRAVSVGVGETVVLWTDISVVPPLNTLAAFVQKVSATGVSLWGAGGVPVNPPARNQTQADIAADGAGGATVTWRTTGAIGDIHAQRFDATGAALWAVGGAPVCLNAADQRAPRIARVSTSYYVVWEDTRGVDRDIFTQRLAAATGAPLFAVDGIAICAAVGVQSRPIVSGKKAPLVLYAWDDARGADVDIYGQVLVPPPFLPAWGVDGAPLVTAVGDQFNMAIDFHPGSTGGTDLVWVDGRNGGSDIYGQRFNDTPAPLWIGGDVAICTAPSDQSDISLVSGETNMITVAWVDNRTPPSNGWTFAQTMDSTGVLIGAANGNAVTNRNQAQPAVAMDGAGGAITVWTEPGPDDSDIYTQRIDPKGNLQWTPNGSPVCTATGDQAAPAVASDGSGGTFIAWLDGRAGVDPRIYAQHTGPDGATLWAADGVLVCSAADVRTEIRIVADGAGGSILAWLDRRAGNFDVYAQHLDATGAPLLAADGVALCAAAGNQTSPQMVRLSPGEAVVVWGDLRAGVSDVYAGRLNAAGVDPAWPVDGAPICTAAGPQDQPQIAEGLVVTWHDGRGGNQDIYAQRIDAATGAVLWGAGDVLICGAAGIQNSPRIVRTTGGAPAAYIVAWADRRNGTPDLYARGLTAAGGAIWTSDGVEVCTGVLDRSGVALAPDVAGGAVFVWTAGQDVFVQRIALDGLPVWNANGILMCGATGDQTAPAIVSDGTGGAIVAWQDPRSLNSRIYAMRVAPQGGLYPTGVEESETPRAFRLSQNTPNPFNPSTRITFSLPSAGRARLDVFDARGAHVARLMDAEQSAGPHSVTWRGVDHSGRAVASGIYFYRLEALGNVLTRMMVLIK